MISIYLIQACLFILGCIPFLCEMSKHFHDSFLTITGRFFIFLITLVSSYYAPMLSNFNDTFVFTITLALLLLSYVQLKKTTISYFKKINNKDYVNEYK